MPTGSQRLSIGAWGSQTGVTGAAWRRLGAPWGLPGEALGPARKTPRDHFRPKVDLKLGDFAVSFFEAVFVEVG